VEALFLIVVVGAIVWYLVKKYGGRPGTRQMPPPSPQLRVDFRLEPVAMAPAPRRQQAGAPAGCTWIAPGQSVTVAGHLIPGGMLYLGHGLPDLAGHGGVEPALIDPSLPLGPPAQAPATMEYWPSYSGIHPAHRAAYLQWLASGRSQPDVLIGLPFLFLYGLERRFFADPAATFGDKQAIAAEVARLLALYASNNSFHGYAGSFLECASLIAMPGRARDLEPPATPARSYEVPLALRVGLGEFAAAGQPIPAAWALAWLLRAPETKIRTPGTRCPQEFNTLFLSRYTTRFKRGLLVKPGKSKLRASYRPSSASFGGREIAIPIGDLPDVTALSGPLGKLQELAEECCDALDAYSRWVGKNPDVMDGLAAVALLPPELAAQYHSKDVMELCRWLDAHLEGASQKEIPGRDLVSRWPHATDGKLSRTEAVLLAQFLEKRGYGVEPDVRFGGPVLDGSGPACVFRLPQEAASTASSNYTGATLLLRLAATVAHADGVVCTEERRQLEQYVTGLSGLGDGDRVRLSAHLCWLLAAPPSLSGLKKRLQELAPEKKRLVAEFLVAVAGADGHIAPAEVKSLIRLYGLLGLDAADVYRDAHALTAGATAVATEPVTIRPAAPTSKGFAIPRPARTPVEPESELTLDVARVRAKLAETVEVSALLGSIFADEEPTEQKVPTGTCDADCVRTLDSAHSNLLRALAGKVSWARADLETLASSSGLLPDGALEQINDLAFEVCGEAFCEGEDLIEVNPQVSKELLS
jgi:tellurite resistance protein